MNSKKRKLLGSLRIPVPRPGCAHGSVKDYDRTQDKADLKKALAGEELDSTYCIHCSQEGQYPQVYVFVSKTLEMKEKPAGMHQLYRRTTCRYRCANGHEWTEWVETPASNPV